MALSTRYWPSGTTLVSALCILLVFSVSVFNSTCFSSHRPDLAWLDYDHDAESLIEATRIPKIISSEPVDKPSNVHTFRNDGEVVVGTDAPRHPLFDILESATSEWESLLDAHGGDQTHALLQYRLHHSGKRRPVSIPSNPLFQLDLFRPISTSFLAVRQRQAEILPDTFTLNIRDGVPRVTYGNLTTLVSEEHRSQRIGLLLDAIRPFVHSLPDFRATFNILPHPRHALPSHAVEVLEALSADYPLPNSPVKFRSQVEPTGIHPQHGRPIHADDLKLLESAMTRQERWTWGNACHTQVDVEETSEEKDRRDGFAPSIRFVASPEARSNACLHRAVTKLHSLYESTDATYHTLLSPIFSETIAPWASDVLLPSFDFFAPAEQSVSTGAIPWANKSAGLFWRGSATEHPPYSVAQLERLIAFTQNSKHCEFIIPTDGGGFRVDHRSLRDVVTWNVQQGDADDKAGAAWKFLIELGNGAQMRAKMASGSLVFRPLLLGDWISEHSVPWVHYVPVQPDLSDLPSLTAFFERHDALAQRIADAGQAWAREQLNHARVRDTLKEVFEGWSRISPGLQEQL